MISSSRRVAVVPVGVAVGVAIGYAPAATTGEYVSR